MTCPKKEIFDGLHKRFFCDENTKKGNLMDYVIRSYDLSKMNIYDSESWRSGEFDGVHNIS